MPKTPKIPIDLTEEDLQEIHDVSKIIKYILNTKNQPTAGRYFDEKHCLIYWPDIFSRKMFTNKFRNWTQMVDLDGAGDDEDEEHRIIMRTERLLGALVIREASIKQALLTNYIRERISAIRQGAHPEIAATQPDELNITDVQSAVERDWRLTTVFRRIEPNKHTILRTRYFLLPAFMEIEPFLPEVPHMLQVLWFVWRHAYHPPLPPLELGIELLRNGKIGVNWRVFRFSSAWPQIDVPSNKPEKYFRGVSKLTPEELMLQFEKGDVHLKTLRKGIMRRDLSVIKPGKISPKLYEMSPGMNAYMHACQQLTSFMLDEDRMDPVTIIDPLILVKHDKVFDGRYHANKKFRKRRLLDLRRPGLDDNLETAVTYRARYTQLMFRPFDYLSEEESKLLLFLEQGHSESIFALRRGKELFFTRPASILRTNHEAPNEREVWVQAIDGLGFCDHYLETGGTEGMTKAPRSKYYKEMNQREKDVVAMRIKGRLFEQLSKRQQRMVSKEASAAYARENPGHAGSRRYHERKQARSMQFIRLQDAAKEVMLMLPGRTEPSRVQFLSKRTVKEVQRIANGSFGRIDLTSELSPRESGLGLSPAPYMLAWSRFCEEMNKVGLHDVNTNGTSLPPHPKVHAQLPPFLRKLSDAELPSIKEEDDAFRTRSFLSGGDRKSFRRQWWPEEDFVLFNRYYNPYAHSRKGMTKKEWDELLAIFVNRTKESCMQRIYTVNNVLQECMAESRYKNYHVGQLRGETYWCVRVIYLYGFATYLSHKKDERIHCNQKGVRHIIKMLDEQVQQLGIPGSYHNYTFFGRFDI